MVITMANLETAEVAENGKATSGRAVENLYRDKSGKLHVTPTEDIVGIVKKFKDTGEAIEFDLRELKPHSLMQAAAFGLHQVGQNAYGAAKDTAEKIELCEARFETILSGEWRSDRQTGPGTSILLQAMIRGYKKKAGAEPDEAWLEEKRELLKDKEVAADFAKRPAIKAHLEAIKAEKAAERARKAAEAAGDDVAEADEEFA